MRCALDESPKHVEFSPVNFVGLSGADVWVSFMSTDEIRYMYFPVKHLFSAANSHLIWSRTKQECMLL